MHKVTCVSRFVSLVVDGEPTHLNQGESVQVAELTDQMRNLERHKVVKIREVETPKVVRQPKASTSAKAKPEAEQKN